eukprot:Skav212326  [mRNA]  locus=scaffold3374:192059:193612:- [translate_table: standard]
MCTYIRGTSKKQFSGESRYFPVAVWLFRNRLGLVRVGHSVQWPEKMPCCFEFMTTVAVDAGRRTCSNLAADVSTTAVRRHCLDPGPQTSPDTGPKPSWIGKSPVGQSNEGLEYTLECKDILTELRDLKLMEFQRAKELVKNCSECPAQLVRSCPVFFFGRSRQGKSTLINDLLQNLGEEDRPAMQDDMKPCTRGVKLHRRSLTEWTTPGMEEELLLFDSEGWELGKPAGNLWEECMSKAKQLEIDKGVLPHRIVLVLVLAAENRHEISDEKFKDLVKEVCDQAKAAAHKAQGGKPVLLPVVSKADLFKNQQIQDQTGKDLKQMLLSQELGIGSSMEVQDPVFVGWMQGEDPSRDCIEDLTSKLSAICKKQLASEFILRAVQQNMENKLMEELQSWEDQGIDATYSLIRRFLWVVARHRNLRVRNLYNEGSPKLSWQDAEKKAEEIRRFAPSGETTEGKDEWHTDPLRRVVSSKERASDTDGIHRNESTSTMTSETAVATGAAAYMNATGWMRRFRGH